MRTPPVPATRVFGTLVRAAGAALLSVGAVVLAAVPSAAEEPARPLKLRVGPSGYEGGRETLEQKVARRMRESEYLFRSICRGCLSQAAEAEVFGWRSNGIEVPVPDGPKPAPPPP